VSTFDVGENETAYLAAFQLPRTPVRLFLGTIGFVHTLSFKIEIVVISNYVSGIVDAYQAIFRQ